MTDWHEKARAMKAAHPEMKTREIADRFGVTLSGAWKALNPERAREYNQRDTRSGARQWKWVRENRTLCTECGHLRGVGSHRGPGLCRACWDAAEAERVQARAERIVAMWTTGLSMRDIASELGWTKGHLSNEMNRLRSKGYDLPHRYSMRSGKRVAA